MSRVKKLRANPWLPGRYENLSPSQVAAQVGTNVAAAQSLGSITPRSMRALDPKSAALRSDGKLCKSLNGL